MPKHQGEHASTFSLHNTNLLSPIWSNPSWRRFSGDCDNLLECLSLESVRRLSFWLSGAFGAFTSTPKWSDRRTEEQDDNNPMVAPPTVTLEFEFEGTRTRLTLAKTLFPLYQTMDGQRTLISTHILAVVTATPHGRLEFVPRTTRPHLTSHRSSVSITTSTGTSGTSEAPHGEPVVQVPDDIPDEMRGKPLVLRRDGSVAQPAMTKASKSNSVPKLFKTLNWAETPLGPREQWPMSLQMIGE